MKDLLDFILMKEPNVQYVVFGSILIGASAAIVGCFLFLRKRSLVGDALAHSVLPGICLAFIFFQTKNPAVLLLGAVFSAWLSLLFINWVIRKSRIKPDTAIGITLSWFFGMGIMLLTAIQKTGNASQSGLDKFLFGKASSLVKQDVMVFGLISVGIILVVSMFFKFFKLISFDRDFAKTMGLPVGFLEFVLSTLTVLSVSTGIQAVGVVLMAAMLITPAAAARFWTNNLTKMVWLAAFFGAFSGIVGAYISYTAPRMPTGPWIVIVVSTVAIFSFLFGAKKGLLIRKLRQFRMQQKVLQENLLKAMYHLGEEDQHFMRPRTQADLVNKRFFKVAKLNSAMRKLQNADMVIKDSNGYAFTTKGIEEGKRITRLHRLWEMYLTEYLKIAPDHVHDDAEAIEHIITPEIEAELELALNKPTADPHAKEIPY